MIHPSVSRNRSLHLLPINSPNSSRGLLFYDTESQSINLPPTFTASRFQLSRPTLRRLSINTLKTDHVKIHNNSQLDLTLFLLDPWLSALFKLLQWILSFFYYYFFYNFEILKLRKPPFSKHERGGKGLGPTLRELIDLGLHLYLWELRQKV